MLQANEQIAANSAGKTYHYSQTQSYQQNQAAVQNQQQYTNFYHNHQQHLNTSYSGHTHQKFNTPQASTPQVNRQQPRMYHQQNNGSQYYHPTTSYNLNQGGFGLQQTFQQTQRYHNQHQYLSNLNHLQSSNGLC